MMESLAALVGASGERSSPSIGHTLLYVSVGCLIVQTQGFRWRGGAGNRRGNGVRQQAGTDEAGGNRLGAWEQSRYETADPGSAGVSPAWPKRAGRPRSQACPNP